MSWHRVVPWRATVTSRRHVTCCHMTAGYGVKSCCHVSPRLHLPCNDTGRDHVTSHHTTSGHGTSIFPLGASEVHYGRTFVQILCYKLFEIMLRRSCFRLTLQKFSVSFSYPFHILTSKMVWRVNSRQVKSSFDLHRQKPWIESRFIIGSDFFRPCSFPDKMSDITKGVIRNASEWGFPPISPNLCLRLLFFFKLWRKPFLST